MNCALFIQIVCGKRPRAIFKLWLLFFRRYAHLPLFKVGGPPQILPRPDILEQPTVFTRTDVMII
jgi:hypothetical protein